MKPTDFAYQVTKYLSKYLPGRQGLSANTIKSYRDTFVLLLNFCREVRGIPPEKLTISCLDEKTVIDFLDWLELHRSCKVSTINNRLSAIHAFFSYLQEEMPEKLYLCQQILDIKSKKSPKPVIDYLTLEGIEKILAQPDTSTRNGYRDMVLISLMYDTGARVQEIADVTVSDVRLTVPATVKLRGKGQKGRIVPIMSQTADYLHQYIVDNSLDSPAKCNHFLFCNRRNEKLTRAGITYILKKYFQTAQISSQELLPDSISPHKIRHSKAMHLLQSGVNLIYIRDLLGHTDVKTTEIYARADSAAKRKALENAHINISPAEKPSWHEDDGILTWLQNFGRVIQ
jgi:site-specific recombinase XerD